MWWNIPEAAGLKFKTWTALSLDGVYVETLVASPQILDLFSFPVMSALKILLLITHAPLDIFHNSNDLTCIKIVEEIIFLQKNVIL